MVLEEVFLLFESGIPYLNAGILTLNINLLFRRIGFHITTKEFNEETLGSLFWGLMLILASNLILFFLQQELTKRAVQPFWLFIAFLISYWFIAKA